MGPKLSGGQLAGGRAKWLQLHKPRKPNSSCPPLPCHPCPCHSLLYSAAGSCPSSYRLAEDCKDPLPSTHSLEGQREGREPRSRRLRTQGWSQGGRRTCTRVARETLAPPSKSLLSTWEAEVSGALSVQPPHVGLRAECLAPGGEERHLKHLHPLCSPPQGCGDLSSAWSKALPSLDADSAHGCSTLPAAGIPALAPASGSSSLET